MRGTEGRAVSLNGLSADNYLMSMVSLTDTYSSQPPLSRRCIFLPPRAGIPFYRRAFTLHSYKTKMCLAPSYNCLACITSRVHLYLLWVTTRNELGHFYTRTQGQISASRPKELPPSNLWIKPQSTFILFDCRSVTQIYRGGFLGVFCCLSDLFSRPQTGNCLSTLTNPDFYFIFLLFMFFCGFNLSSC